MKYSILIGLLVAFTAGPVSYALAGASCPKNSGKHAKTSKAAPSKTRVVAALIGNKVNKSPTAKKPQVRVQ